eukprot:TRINITY_DN5860_c0_g1_i1.p1 TRINITY_DN5860_c0_g1~~TRINITY_DN5860_c0_g1_i1.p1  ORF type:complete len:136 (+),score=29.72 TRINITY_DN5860_c0_g1_i1:175-582(+)
MLPVIFPIFRSMLRKALSINQENAILSVGIINECFDEVSRLLEVRNGKIDQQEGITKFLLGESITAADITFASLGAIVLQPDNYGYPVTKEEILRSQLSQEFWNLVDGWRATRAGRFVLNLYKFHRPTPKPTLVF